MAPLTRQRWQPNNWGCSICCQDYVGAGQPPGLPWATESNKLVCESCVKRLFQNALQYDISWPARWGAEILPIVDFNSIFSADFVRAYEEKEKDMTGRHAAARTDLPMELVRGVDYQLCPWCKIILCHEDDNNHVVCPCGASLCFICGNAAFDRHGAFNHWGHGGCPRHGTLGSGRERYDRGHYNNREPHLVPLGRVFGVSLYVNGDDHEYGSLYKNNSNLGWDECNHKHDIFDKWGEKYPSFENRRAIACWNFNVAMQTGPPHQRITLRRLLDEHSGDITFEQYRTILAAMFNLTPLHGISTQQWQRQSKPDGRYRWCNEELVSDLIRLRPDVSENNQHYPFALLRRPHHLGLLYAPIAALFTMSLRNHREQALLWLDRAIANYTSADDPSNLAIFSLIGPRSPEAQVLFLYLKQRALVLPRHRVTFETFTNCALLVWVRERNDPELGRLPMADEMRDRLRSAFVIAEHYDLMRLGLVQL